MSAIKLVKPTMEYEDDIWQFRQEILASGDKDAFAGCGGLETCKTVGEWIDTRKQWEFAETCPRDKVPCHTYLAIREADQRIVGIKKVMVTCDEDNIASEKTILACGGVFEKEIEVDGCIIKRYWITVDEGQSVK